MSFPGLIFVQYKSINIISIIIIIIIKPIYTKLTYIYAKRIYSPADSQMRGNLNPRALRAQGAFVRDGPQWE